MGDRRSSTEAVVLREETSYSVAAVKHFGGSLVEHHSFLAGIVLL